MQSGCPMGHTVLKKTNQLIIYFIKFKNFNEPGVRDGVKSFLIVYPDYGHISRFSVSLFGNGLVNYQLLLRALGLLAASFLFFSYNIVYGEKSVNSFSNDGSDNFVKCAKASDWSVVLWLRYVFCFWFEISDALQEKQRYGFWILYRFFYEDCYVRM